MPDKPNTIYLCDSQEVPDVKAPECLPGRVAVLMYTAEKRGSIYMPGSGRLNPDVGKVVSSGTRWLKPGDEVLVKPYDGKWIDDYQDSGHQLRLYGVVCPWSDSIVAVRTPIGLEPTHDWVLIRRKPAPTSLILPDIAGIKSNFGEIVMFGDACPDISVGQECVFVPDEELLDFAFGEEQENILIRYDSILSVIQE